MEATTLNYGGARNPYTKQAKRLFNKPAEEKQSYPPISTQTESLLREAAELPAQERREEEIREAIRTNRERKRTRAQALALEYSQALGFDVASAAGRSWTEKTAKFYESSDDLLNRLSEIVAQARQAGLLQ